MATATVAELRSTSTAVRPLADMKPKEQIAYLLEQKKGELQKMLPKTLSIERLLKVAQIAATTTPALAKCDVPSLVGAIGQCAQMGLEPNTVLGHAYLVPFNTKRKDGQGNERWVNSVQVIIGYKGLIDLARRSGQIVSIAAHEVCERDHFELVYGLDEKLNHTPAMGERGELVGFYAVAKLKDGGHSFEFMSVHQVQEIMRATQSKGKYGPWADHFTEMGRKTVIRRLAKYLPLSIEFQTAAALDGMAEAGKDQGNTIDGSGNKTNFNQRAGNYNDYLSNWYETGTYSPAFSGHGGFNKWIGNRLPSGKTFVTQCGDHVWSYQYLSSDPSDREHNSHRALYWGNLGAIQDGYRDDSAKTVVPTETQIVPTTGQTYTNIRATGPSLTAPPPTGYTLVPAVKLTAAVVGPGAAWIVP